MQKETSKINKKINYESRKMSLTRQCEGAFAFGFISLRLKTENKSYGVMSSLEGLLVPPVEF